MATKNSRSKKRDRVWERKNKDGTATYKAVVRIRPFKPAVKSFKTRAAAKSWADALVKELTAKNEAGNVDADSTARTIRELVEKFLGDIKIKGDGTPDYPQQKWYPDLQYLLAWWVSRYGGVKVREFGEDQIVEGRDLLCKGRKPATVNRYLAAMRRAWNKGQKKPEPWPKDIFLSEPKERVKFLPDAELKALLAEAEKHSPWMLAAVVTSIGTGLRQGELLRLVWGDINFEKQTVTVRAGKNTTGEAPKSRTVHLPPPAADALKKMRVVGPKQVFVRSDGELIDKSRLRVQWLEVRKAAGVDDLHWHDLRHCCASYYAQAGASLIEIGSVLGHTNPSITKKYSHMVEGAAITG